MLLQLLLHHSKSPSVRPAYVEMMMMQWEQLNCDCQAVAGEATIELLLLLLFPSTHFCCCLILMHSPGTTTAYDMMKF